MARGVNKVILAWQPGQGSGSEIHSRAAWPLPPFRWPPLRRAKDKDGNWQDRTEWHNVKAFERTAEVAGEYLKKGSTVYIEGRLHSESWDDKETGQKKYKTEVIVNELVMVGGRARVAKVAAVTAARDRAAQSPSGGFDQRVPEHEEAPAHSSAGEITDEDIPF